MRKMMICFAIYLVFVLTSSAMAEVKADSFSITSYLGGYLFEGNQDLKHSLALGLRGGYSFTKQLGLEGYVHYVKSEFESLAGNPEMKVFGYGLDGLYHFMPESRLVPFLALGAGNTFYDPEGGNNHNKLTINYGGGLKYFLTENIALRVDVRHVMPFNDRFNDLLYTFGVTFAFGGEKKKAIPVAAPAFRDADDDGVLDNLDKCLETPAGVKVGRDGCPLDSDGDGVYDYLDKCPETPAGVKVDKDGCPRPTVSVEEALVEKGRVTLNVQFDFDKAVVKPEYHDEIGYLAAVLSKHPDLKIIIEGHTDNVGEMAYNIRISLHRADAVKNYLVEKFGIDAARLNTKGYGPNRPVESNDTAEGRQKNRRVEAVVEYITTK